MVDLALVCFCVIHQRQSLGTVTRSLWRKFRLSRQSPQSCFLICPRICDTVLDRIYGTMDDSKYETMQHLNLWHQIPDNILWIIFLVHQHQKKVFIQNTHPRNLYKIFWRCGRFLQLCFVTQWKHYAIGEPQALPKAPANRCTSLLPPSWHLPPTLPRLQ